MAVIRLSGQTSTFFDFQPLMMDEFIPVVEFDRGSFNNDYGYLSGDKNESTLSEYIDEKLRKIQPKIVETEVRKIKLPFSIKQGCVSSNDPDGNIETKLSISNPEIQIISGSSLTAKYGDTFEIELDIQKKADIEFYINFYANDDNDSNEGELKDIHCGRVKVQFSYTVTTDWDTIAPVIPKNKFIGWNHPGIKQNCMDYALEQLRQVNHWVRTERWNKKWDGTKELNDYIFQLYLDADVAGMKKGSQKNQFEPGITYLKETLKKGIPVLVGVDDGVKSSNDDLTTEHFVVVVGMGEDTNGKYFLFYDNAVTEMDIGTSDKNRLYCQTSTFIVEGKGDPRNGYITTSGKRGYIISQIRETK